MKPWRWSTIFGLAAASFGLGLRVAIDWPSAAPRWTLTAASMSMTLIAIGLILKRRG